MASKVKKGFLYYLLWFVFIVFGIACIFATILFFNPGKDVFGIGLKYISNSNNIKENQVLINSQKVYIEDLEISDINVSAGFSTVKVVEQNTYDRISILIDGKISGFAKKGEKATLSYSITYNDSVLNIAITEPQTWLSFSKSSIVTICCPLRSTFFSNINFNIQTKSGDVNIGTSREYDLLTLNSVNVKTESGDVNFLSNVGFASGEATIEAQKSITVDCNITKMLTVKTNSAKLKVGDITGGLTIDSNELSAKCATIGGDVIYSSAKGFITINKVCGNFSASTDEEKTHIANVTILEALKDVTIPEGKASTIKLGKVLGNIKLDTTTGDITINECGGNVDISTTKGSVKLMQTSPNSTVIVSTQSGDIVANYLEACNTTITSETGDIKINIASGKSYIVKYSTQKSISIDWVTTELAKQGEQKSPDYAEAHATINATTEKDIVITSNFVKEED